MTEKKRKKVLYLITKANWGGAQRLIFDVANNVPRSQYEPVMAFGGHGELEEKCAEAGIRTISIDNLKRDVSIVSEIKVLIRTAKIIHKEKPDVLHVTSSKAGAVGSILGRILFVPKVVFTICGWAFNEDRPPLQKFTIKTIHWLTVLFAHDTIAISHSLRRDMDWPFAQRKITVIHPGRAVPKILDKDMARSFLSSHETQSNGMLKTYNQDFWIGTIAELHPIKRLDVAINAVSKLVTEFPRLRFVIIHDGQERERLQSQVQKLGLTKHVFFMGVIPDAAQYIPAFDVFVLPSKSEAFGYVLVEAGLAQVAVVATNVGGIPDIVVDGETGLLVPPDDTDTLSHALRKLITDEELRRHLATAHHARSQEFTIGPSMQKIIDLYNA